MMNEKPSFYITAMWKNVYGTWVAAGLKNRLLSWALVFINHEMVLIEMDIIDLIQVAVSPKFVVF